MCRQMLNPFEREAPRGSNSQAAEQQWIPLVKATRSLNYMKPQNFKFFSLTMHTLLNKWKLDGGCAAGERDDKKARSQSSHRGTAWVDGKPIPKKNNHAVRAEQIKAKSKRGKKRRSKRSRQTVTVRKRLPLTKGMIEVLPNGFDERLKSTSGGRRVLRDIPTALFKEHVAFLAAGVREALGTDGTPSLEARWRGRVFLHKWMVDRLVEQQQQLGQQLGGGMGVACSSPI